MLANVALELIVLLVVARVPSVLINCLHKQLRLSMPGLRQLLLLNASHLEFEGLL